ncbi:MAG TPA: hypothetical protein V6D12_24015 [Candidatus Obscuribacterales bacterium]
MLHSLNYLLLYCGSVLGLLSVLMSLIYLGWHKQNSREQVNDIATAKPDVETLIKECLRLREQLQQQKLEATSEMKEAAFQQLQPLLINYPSLQQIVQVKPDLPAKNLISLLTPLDNLLSFWGYEPIGYAWEQVAYDPQLHQPDSPDIEVGETVYVRFIGYREGDRILCPAKVSRSLPGGAK